MTTSPVGASNYPALAATVPGTSTLGVPLGTGTSRFAVQIAYPTGAVLGPSFILGTNVLNEAVWNDVTRDVMSVSWDRGGSAGDNPLAGQLNVILANTIVNEARKYSPAKSTYWGPGTMIRVVAGDPTSLASVQITGITQTWDESFTGGQRTVSITALEPTFMLIRVDDPPIVPIGDGDNLTVRAQRIADAAEFAFTLQTNYGSALAGTQTFQATDLTSDLLAELQLTVDSVDGQFFMTKAAKLEVCERAALYVTSSYILGAGGNVPIRLDQLTSANDDKILLSQVSLTRANGMFTFSFTNQAIAARYHPSSITRTDLITSSDADLAVVGNGRLNRGTQTLRPVSCTVGAPSSPTTTAATYAFLMAVDLYMVVDVMDAAFVTFQDYAICRMSHTITPGPSRVNWECVLEFEPTPGSLTFGGSTDTSNYIVDDSGNILVDDSGNFLVWS